MENLNAEQVKKGLERCTSYCDKDNCPYKTHDIPIACMTMRMVDALALITSQEQRIKELTEVVERSKTAQGCEESVNNGFSPSVTELQREKERLKARVLEENHLRHQSEEMLANGMSAVKADTVRKMQERFLELLEKEHRLYTPEDADFMFKNGSIMMWSIAERVFRQIAKEMLEREK